MASRGAFGFRSAKQTEKSTEPLERIPVGPTRRASIISTTSNSLKLPMQSTSFFSRGKSRTKVDPSTSRMASSSGIPVGRLQDSAKTSSGKSERGARSAVEPGRSVVEPGRGAGLGISTMNQITAAQPHTYGKSIRNVLRRKAPLDQRGKYPRTESSASSYELAPSRPSREIASTPETYSDHFAGSVLGITVPAVTSTTDQIDLAGLGPNFENATSSSRMASFNTRKPPQPSSTPNLSQPTPTFVHGSESSTRRSESPGNFSRTSTPTTMSSQSPGVGTPIKAPLRGQTSPTRSRPPVTRRKFPAEDIIPSQNSGLTAVRESATSSSSSSTIKASEQRRDGSQVRSDRDTPLPPSPPTRQSSRRPVHPEEVGLRRGMSKGVPEQSSGSASSIQNQPNSLIAGHADTSRLDRIRSPPPRPSREGTPRLDDAFEPSPMIHTRLPPLQTSGHRRRLSQDKDTSSAESKSGVLYSGRPALGRSPSIISSTSGKPSRMPSPNTLVANPARPPPGDSFRPPIVVPVDTNASGPRLGKEPSPLSASSNRSLGRFGMFTKRTKSPLEVTPIESADKAGKKGPAAGTGHEGYGRYSRRGRSGSTSTSASRGRSTSTASAGRTPSSRKSSFTSRDEPMDDFLSARLAPVVIPGGGRAADSPFHGSSHYPSSSGESSAAMTSSDDLLSRGPTPSQHPSTVLIAEASGTHHLRRDYRKLPHRKENSEYAHEQQQKEVATIRQREPTLAVRRSAHRSQAFGPGAEPLKLPAPIDVRAQTTSPGMDSRDTVQSSIRSDVSDISEGHEGNWLKSRRTEKRVRSPRKWNFFHKAQASPKRLPDTILPRLDDERAMISELPATVFRVPEARSVPFYALLDGSEQEDLDQVGSSSAVETMQPSADSSAVSQSREHRLSLLLPSPPTHTTEFLKPQGPLHPPVVLRPPEVDIDIEPTPTPEPKKPRLQQVGRIPRVVSKRDRPHKPPPQSFSRPFARHPALGVEPPALALVQRAAETERPLLGIQTDIVPSDPWGSQDASKPASAPVQQSETFTGTGKHEFLSFPTRIGSQISGVSGSSSSGILSFAATTAVIPDPGTAPEEDEVWHEYNEFLDTVGSSPAQLSNDSGVAQEGNVQKSRWVPAPLQITKEPSLTESPEKISFEFPSLSAPTGPLPSPPDRSKLLAADLPSTPGTISDLLAGYGERNRSSGISQRKSGYTASRYSTSSIESAADSEAHREGTQTTFTQVTATVAPLFQSNLRFNALMTSRWLSFDRVLFSPAHVELDSDRLLVLDGIGNDDWSFYCAETYKDASIFNLSPSPSRPQQQNAALRLPKNHRQIQLASLANRFPFPPGFFSTAVLRFPSATTEVGYLNAISECMRVLRPGGYLEMSILDLDMANMGNKARKALRELKVRMQVSQPGVTIKPLSDNIQKIAKRSGFKNLQRTLINIPVAGVVNDSRSNSIDAKSGSLENLRKEASGNGDGGLAKTLPQVGRWWFTRCYELGSMPYEDTERSIWNDKALLEECEKKETSFRLLLCCAQKPTIPPDSSDTRSKALRTKH